MSVCNMFPTADEKTLNMWNAANVVNLVAAPLALANAEGFGTL